MSRFLHRAALACATVAITALPLASPASAAGAIRMTPDLICTMNVGDVLIYENTGTTIHDFTVFDASGTVPIASSGPVPPGLRAPVITASALPPQAVLNPGWFPTRDVIGTILGTALPAGTLTIQGATIDPSITTC